MGEFVLTGNTIADNVCYDSGGGVYIYAYTSRTGNLSAINLTGNFITGNTSRKTAGGIYIYSSADSGHSDEITMADNIMADNESVNHNAGAAYLYTRPCRAFRGPVPTATWTPIRCSRTPPMEIIISPRILPASIWASIQPRTCLQGILKKTPGSCGGPLTSGLMSSENPL